ncbi:hypothetical protein IGI04_033367, partial [Brassica rapa subsp. trilocularis]
NLNNLWSLKEKQSHSSATKKIFRIKIIPGDGRSTRFWSDNWSPMGNLKKHSATLHDLYHQGSWHLPQPRSEAQLNILIHLSTITLSTPRSISCGLREITDIIDRSIDRFLIRNRISSFRDQNPILSSKMLHTWFDN